MSGVAGSSRDTQAKGSREKGRWIPGPYKRRYKLGYFNWQPGRVSDVTGTSNNTKVE